MPLKHVLIVGAGLSGPALALALHPLKCTILERHQTIQDLGGVIMLAPNAMRVMQSIQIADKLRDVGYSFDAIHVHTADKTGSDYVGGLQTDDHTMKSLSIARPILHKVLVDRCKELGIEMRYGCKLASIEEGESEVTAVLEQGERLKGDILIGCDGIGSPVRKHILGDRDPGGKYSGIVTVGDIVPSSSVPMPDNVKLPAFIYTQKGTFLSFSMDQSNSHMQWVTTIRAPERDRRTGWNEYRTSGQAVRDVQAFYKEVNVEPIKTWVQNLSNDQVKVWAPYVVPDLPTWHTKRTCILGDAAHAIPPSAGQGSAQAFEDTALLARLLNASQTSHSAGSETERLEALFEQFEQKRKKRMEVIRRMTSNAEAIRGETSSWGWFFKSRAISASFWVLGKARNIRGRGIFDYNVLEEKISVWDDQARRWMELPN